MIRYLTAGESHGEALIGIVEGVPAGVPLTADYVNRHLARRWLGFGRGGRAKFEKDLVHIYSGVRFSETMGSPIALRLDNEAYTRDRSSWPEVMAVGGTGEGVEPVVLPRPGHADLTGAQKYGFDDIRPVIDRSSARETAMRVACCSVARRLLAECGIFVGSHVVRIGEVGFGDASEWRGLADGIVGDAAGAGRPRAAGSAGAALGAERLNDVADASEVRMLDPSLSAACVEHIKAVKKEGDSLGGIYEVVVTGVPAGLGSYVQWDRRLDGQLAQAIMSIQAQKAVEIGDGVAAASDRGSRVHDPIRADAGGSGDASGSGGGSGSGPAFSRTQNRAGGIEGGMSNGMPIIVRGYMKPIPTLIKPLGTAHLVTGEEQPTRYERSDVTSVPAGSTVAEAVVAHVLANALLEKFGGDSLGELRQRVEAAR